MEFWFDRIEDMFEDVPKLTLDLAKLSLLHGLTVMGPSWDCNFEKFVFDILFYSNRSSPSLPSLRTAHLAYLTVTTQLMVLYSAPNLTELAINIRNNYTTLRRKVFLPCLVRKLDVLNDSHLSAAARLRFFELLEVRVRGTYSPRHGVVGPACAFPLHEEKRSPHHTHDVATSVRQNP